MKKAKRNPEDRRENESRSEWNRRRVVDRKKRQALQSHSEMDLYDRRAMMDVIPYKSIKKGKSEQKFIMFEYQDGCLQCKRGNGKQIRNCTAYWCRLEDHPNRFTSRRD